MKSPTKNQKSEVTFYQMFSHVTCLEIISTIMTVVIFHVETTLKAKYCQMRGKNFISVNPIVRGILKGLSPL